MSDVPVSRRLKFPKIRRQLSDDLVNTLKRPIGEVFKLEKIQRRFSKNQRLIYALEELSQPYNYSTQPRVISIFNNNETVAGIVSPTEILNYIKSDITFGELKVEQLLSEEFHIEDLYKLLPSDTLDKAYFAVKYLSVDYIMICDDNSDILGIVERHQVIALTHPMYYELMDMPLVEIMKPMDKLYLVESSQPVKEIIASFLELGIGAAIAVDRSASQVRPTMVITPITILQLCLKNFRQKRK